MFKNLVTILLLIFTFSAFSVYNIGDTVEDFSFQEVDFTTGSAVYTDRTISEITAEGKTVIIYFVNLSFL